VFAAASLTDVVTVLSRRFEAERGIPVRESFGASSTLARQIEQGAPADVFISADGAWMDYLAERRPALVSSRSDLVSNRLVLVAEKSADIRVQLEPGVDLAGAFEGRLALGHPEHVPAGRYARSALESLGAWDALAARLLPAEDVRAALRLVEIGEASVGIVYASDATSSPAVRIVATFPEATHTPIRYPMAACSPREEARLFLEFLRSPGAQEVFTAAGFVPLP